MCWVVAIVSFRGRHFYRTKLFRFDWDGFRSYCIRPLMEWRSTANKQPNKNPSWECELFFHSFILKSAEFFPNHTPTHTFQDQGRLMCHKYMLREHKWGFRTPFKVLSARKIDTASCAVSKLETYRALSCDLFAWRDGGGRGEARKCTKLHGFDFSHFSPLAKSAYRLTFSFFSSSFNRLNQRGMPENDTWSHEQKRKSGKREMARETASRNNSV